MEVPRREGQSWGSPEVRGRTRRLLRGGTSPSAPRKRHPQPPPHPSQRQALPWPEDPPALPCLSFPSRGVSPSASQGPELGVPPACVTLLVSPPCSSLWGVPECSPLAVMGGSAVSLLSGCHRGVLRGPPQICPAPPARRTLSPHPPCPHSSGSSLTPTSAEPPTRGCSPWVPGLARSFVPPLCPCPQLPPRVSPRSRGPSRGGFCWVLPSWAGPLPLPGLIRALFPLPGLIRALSPLPGLIPARSRLPPDLSSLLNRCWD